MSKPKKRKNGNDPWWLSPRLGGLLLLTLGLYVALSLVGGSVSWWNLLNGRQSLDLWSTANPAGPLGNLTAFAVVALLGRFFCWLLPIWLFWRGATLLGRGSAPWLPLRGKLPILWLAAAAWLGQTGMLMADGEAAWTGGIAGFYLAQAFGSVFGRWGTFIFLSFFLLTALVWIFRPWLKPLLDRVGPLMHDLGDLLGLVGGAMIWLLRAPARLLRGVMGIWRGVGDDMASLRQPARTEKAPRAMSAAAGSGQAGVQEAPPVRRVHMPPAPAGGKTPNHEATDETPDDIMTVRRSSGSTVSTMTRKAAAESEGDFPEAAVGMSVEQARRIDLPDPSLLQDPPDEVQTISDEALHASADLLESTLRSFGVDGTVKDVRPGPVVTTFEYQPATGIKVSAIVQRSDDLALAMKARSIRMEAPIPGKAAVGIEIPNPIQQMVTMKDVYLRAAAGLEAPLAVVLGQDVFGEPVAIDLAAQPHLLVAGSTGSGKSVCINAMITSLLLRCDPSIVRLMLIDPKMLELNVYNGIPHLLLPVITDPKEALRSLKWMEAQMDHRYRRLSKHGVRNIEGYNRKVAAGQIVGVDGEIVTEPLPYFVCIVDELADLMVQLGQEIEVPITRIAQKARAVGIHLILATQRPSVDVLTGVIKANIPCRIAFRVIQRNDSRTILDANGAEQLLGRGDMLYLQPGRAQPIRVHGAFVDIEECEMVADHWRNYQELTSHITLAEEPESGPMGEIENDTLFEKAREVIVYAQHGSTSMLQRKLGVGYARAGRLMDLLEQAGVVGPFIGSKAREVLMRTEDLQAMQELEEDDFS